MKIGQVLVIRTGPARAVREAVVVEVRGPNAGPPFLVRWRDTGRTTLLVPDGDTWPKPPQRRSATGTRGNRCG